jgi:hypothetical protein
MKRKKKNRAVDESVRLMEVFGSTLKFREKVPDEVAWHVCLTTPTMGQPNHEGKCGWCGGRVYFCDVINAPKICPACHIKNHAGKKFENVMTREQRDRAANYTKRN